MAKKFIKEQSESKEILNATIDKSLMNMIKEVRDGFKISISKATNDILDYFKTEIWDKDLVCKTKEEEQEAKQEEETKS